MWTEEDLPESDLESVYGRDALYTRIRSTTDRLFKQYAVTNRTLEALYQRLNTPDEPQQNSS